MRSVPLLLLAMAIAKGDMIRNDAIGNDPAKEKLCIERSISSKVGTKIVPFEIDSRYLARVRSNGAGNPGMTFIAMENQIGDSVLITCDVNPGTGKYGPMSEITERPGFWQLIKPKQFEPGLKTREGIVMAGNACRQAAQAKIDLPNFDHSVYSNVVEVNIGRRLYRPGSMIAGKPAQRYDVAVTGTALYKSSGPDLKAVNFTCLFSPMLEVKAIRFK